MDVILGLLYQRDTHNDSLSNVDKFTYLRGLLDEPAKSAIDGFALTSDNYLSATKLLQRRFGNKTVVQRAYINELLNVFSDSDERLRKLVDVVETNSWFPLLPLLNTTTMILFARFLLIIP